MNDELKQIEDKLNEVQDILDKLNAVFNNFKHAENHTRWRGDDGQSYYFIDEFFKPKNCLEEHELFDDNNYRYGNYYRTTYDVDKALAHLKIKQQLIDLALRLNMGVPIDWSDSNQLKYYLFKNDTGNIAQGFTRCAICQMDSTFCLNENFKDIAIAEIGEGALLSLFDV